MIKANFKIDSPFENELMEIVRAFSAYIEVDENSEIFVKMVDTVTENKIKTIINITGQKEFCGQADLPNSAIEHKKSAKRFSKSALYNNLAEFLNVQLPYGSLTGVRPTKLYYELENNGKDAGKVLSATFKVSDEKINHIKNIINNQKGILNKNEKEVDIFINIPFCPTRCTYCSFVAVSMKQLKKYLENYVLCLKSEISILKNIVLENSFKVRAVYIGGGTPTSLPVQMLESIISECDFNAREFTVEAGRPDTVNKDMLDMLSRQNVTRISINPQTFHNKTLKRIGRAHTVEDTINAYTLARNYDFDINMDLIAVLPDESFEDFRYSIDKAIELKPENITVHTLSLKRGSELTLNNFDNNSVELAENMVNYSVLTLENASYLPYYMYRQKYVSGNLENSGYALSGHACVYNIDIMEENTSILAAGAGAISKRIFKSENRLERQANIKDVKGYIERFDEIKIKKVEFWK